MRAALLAPAKLPGTLRSLWGVQDAAYPVLPQPFAVRGTPVTCKLALPIPSARPRGAPPGAAAPQRNTWNSPLPALPPCSGTPPGPKVTPAKPKVGCDSPAPPPPAPTPRPAADKLFRDCFQRPTRRFRGRPPGTAVCPPCDPHVTPRARSFPRARLAVAHGGRAGATAPCPLAYSLGQSARLAGSPRAGPTQAPRGLSKKASGLDAWAATLEGCKGLSGGCMGLRRSLLLSEPLEQRR